MLLITINNIHATDKQTKHKQKNNNKKHKTQNKPKQQNDDMKKTDKYISFIFKKKCLIYFHIHIKHIDVPVALRKSW